MLNRRRSSSVSWARWSFWLAVKLANQCTRKAQYGRATWPLGVDCRASAWCVRATLDPDAADVNWPRSLLSSPLVRICMYVCVCACMRVCTHSLIHSFTDFWRSKPCKWGSHSRHGEHHYSSWSCCCSFQHHDTKRQGTVSLLNRHKRDHMNNDSLKLMWNQFFPKMWHIS